MESAGRERGKEVRKRPAGGGKRQGNAKKILNRGNELNKSFRINKSRKKRTQNELDFECKNARITPKKRVLGGTFHATNGSSVRSRFPESLLLAAARPPHPSRHGGLFDQYSEPESLIKFAHQDEAAVRGDAGTLAIDLGRGVEGELEGLILYFTNGVQTSGASSWRLHPHKY